MRRLLKIVGGGVLVLAAVFVALVIHANWAISRTETRAPGDGAPGRMLTIAGHQWHVLTKNDPRRDPTGAPILLVHGFIVAGAETFQPWASTQLGDRSLILPDLLGYGHSQRIPVSGPWYSLRSYANGLAEMLDRLGVAQVDIVGHSYGGAVAAEFALDHPDRVRRIVFMDAGIYYAPSGTFDGIVQLPLGIGRAAAWHAFGAGPWGINTLACKRRGCRWGELARVAGTTDTLRAMMRSHRTFIQSDPLIPRIPLLRKPAMVIWGDNDRVIPLSDGKRLARETGARLVVIKGGRHMPSLWAAKEVGKDIREFLRQNQR